MGDFGCAKIENKVRSYMAKIEEDPLKDNIGPQKVSRIFSGSTFYYHRKGFNSIALRDGRGRKD
jgi:hypothetical protein